MPAEKKLDAAGKAFWRDPQGVEYGLVVAGIGWPSVKPGYLVVGGVLALEDVELEGHRIQILDEGEDPDLSGLFRLALKAKNEFATDRIYAYPDPAFNEMIRLFNRDRAAKGLYPLSFRDTEMKGESEKILAIVSLVTRLTRSSRKLLTFGPDSKLRGYLTSISPEEANADDIFDHPPVAALGAALGVLSKWRPGRESMSSQAIMDFDPGDPFATSKRAFGQGGGAIFE